MNVELLLWCIVITNFVNAICNIIAGATGAEKSRTYGCGNVICGIMTLIIAIVVVST